jgi:hypothetical protein
MTSTSFTAFHAGSCLGLIVQREAALRLRPRHGPSVSQFSAPSHSLCAVGAERIPRRRLVHWGIDWHGRCK